MRLHSMNEDQQQGKLEPRKTFYVASRTARAGFWLSLQRKFPNMRASWIYEAGPGETKDLAELWTRIEDEVSTSFALFLYLARGDMPLKGAFVEVGMALANKIPVYVFPQSIMTDNLRHYIGSWISHPLVMVLDSSLPLEEAVRIVAESNKIPVDSTL